MPTCGPKNLYAEQTSKSVSISRTSICPWRAQWTASTYVSAPASCARRTSSAQGGDRGARLQDDAGARIAGREGTAGVRVRAQVVIAHLVDHAARHLRSTRPIEEGQGPAAFKALQCREFASKLCNAVRGEGHRRRGPGELGRRGEGPEQEPKGPRTHRDPH